MYKGVIHLRVSLCILSPLTVKRFTAVSCIFSVLPCTPLCWLLDFWSCWWIGMFWSDTNHGWHKCILKPYSRNTVIIILTSLLLCHMTRIFLVKLLKYASGSFRLHSHGPLVLLLYLADLELEFLVAYKCLYMYKLYQIMFLECFIPPIHCPLINRKSKLIISLGHFFSVCCPSFFSV